MGYDRSYLEKLISDKVEESLHLDYKAGDALVRNKTKDITKDISSMANSAGGVIIYGISETADKSRLPSAISPINCHEFSKEWLEQIASSIQPRIDGLIIHPIYVGPDLTDYCYVVEIPPSNTAHQATDYRYYKRQNFQSTPMYDYEVRDVMNRLKHPEIAADVEMTQSPKTKEISLHVKLINKGAIIALHYRADIELPCRTPIGQFHPFENKNEWGISRRLGTTYWRTSVGGKGASPLFPTSSWFYSRKLALLPSGALESPSEAIMRVTLFADSMTPKTLDFDVLKVMSKNQR